MRKPFHSPPLPATSNGCSRNTTAPCGGRERCSDVLLPEVDRTLYEVETRLAEQDQEDAIWMRRDDARG